MADIAGLEYTKLLLAADGSLAPGATADYPAGVTDVIVISHGWHVDPDDADGIYHKLIGNLVAEAGRQWAGAGRKFGVVGIFWPSDKFRDDLSAEGFVPAPSGTGTGAAAAFGDAKETALLAQAKDLAAFLQIGDADEFLAEVKRAAKGNGKNGDAEVLVKRLQKEVRKRRGGRSANLARIRKETEREHAELLDPACRRRIIADLAAQGTPGAINNLKAGGAAAAFKKTGRGAALGVLSGIRAGVARLLNQFAYFEMKKRAGVVGTEVGRRLVAAAELDGVRIHLVGHSFGARLVTAAALTMGRRHPSSLTLLQGAFSHNGFGTGIVHDGETIDGAFRKVVAGKLVDGPIAVTHTWNDTAVGLAYAAASRVSGTVASSIGVTRWFGGPDDIFGGLGANGALRLATGEGSSSTFDGKSVPALRDCHVNNLLCDFIVDHNDVTRPEVARILKASLALQGS